MHSLQHNGFVIEGTHNLISHATKFYKELLGSAPGNLVSIDPNLWSDLELIYVEDTEIFMKPFTVEEVNNALFL